MRIRVVTVGARAPQWVTDGFADYVRRMPRHLPVELHEIPAPSRKRSNIDQCRRDEAHLLRKAAGEHALYIVLDERGRSWRSLELARKLEAWMADGRDLAFLIGGPDGLDPQLRAQAHAQWSLSALTLPHALVRILLAEQLYRAWTLLQGHPYHRE